MSDQRADQPAYALRPPATSEGAVSGAKLVTQRAEAIPFSSSSQSGAIEAAPEISGVTQRTPANGQWGELATAPTLLLTPREKTETDDDASTSRIATPPAMAADPAWFRSGNTVPPPSMRPSAESAPTLAEKKPANPRVVKIVGGVIGACLFIVAVASVKLLYQRAVTDDVRPSAEETTSPAASVGKVEPAPAAPPSGATSVTPGSPEPAAPASSHPAAARAETNAHAAPLRAPSPARVTTKPAPRRAPTTKKVVRH